MEKRTSVLLLSLICLTPFIGALLGFSDFPRQEIYICILQSIAPICAFIVTILGIKRRDTAYSLLNLIFILPYSILGISLLKFIFDVQNIYFFILIFPLYILNAIIFSFYAVPEKTHEYKYVIGRIALSLFLFTLLFYIMDPLKLNQKAFLLAIVLVPNILIYSREFLRSFSKYREEDIKEETDFLLLSQILGWILLGIGLVLGVENWHAILPFSVLANIFYLIYNLDIFQTKNTGKFLMLGSFGSLLLFLSISALTLHDPKEAYIVVLFSVLALEMHIGLIAYGSFFADLYKEIRIAAYFGFLCGIFYVIGVMPSDFLSPIPTVRIGDIDAILFPLSTIVQSLAAVLAILTTFITFVFIYVLTGKKSEIEEKEKTKVEIADLVLLSFLLTTTLALGYRLVKIILLVLEVMGRIGSSVVDNMLIINIIRDSQAAFWIVLMYLLIVGSVLMAFHIRYHFKWKGMEKIIPELRIA